MTEESIKYENGDIVWVKLLYCWWPGEVISLDKVPAEVRESFKQPPLAVVRFFQEDTFEYIKSGHSKNICLYASERKNDYIKRGMDLVRSKTKASLMTKFPADVCNAERLTEGNPNILNEPQFAELLVPSSSAMSAIKRRNSGDSSTGGGTPSGRSRGRGRGGTRGRGRGRGARMSTGSIVENKFFSSPSPKKPKKEIIVTHPRFINDDIDDHEIVRLIQTKRPSIESPVREDYFNCNSCDFKTTRVDVMVMHREIHSQKPVKWRTTSPKKPRKIYQMPKSKTKTLEEDLAIVRSGKTIEDYFSDEEISHKRAKKSKSTPKHPKEKKEKKEDNKLDTIKPTKKEELKKIDRELLVAEWNEIEESEDEMQGNHDNKIEESKSNINDAVKSCFDFDEEDSNGILTKVEGRKIPRLIPETERPQSPKIEPVPETCATESTVYPAEMSNERPLKDLSEDEKEPVAKIEDLALLNQEEKSAKKSPAADLDLGMESFESILEATSVPELPEIPQIPEKCEQNFHDTRTIKFPDKTDPAPIHTDKDDSNGFIEKVTSDDTPFAENIDAPFVEKIDAPFAEKIDAPFAEKIDAPFAEKIDAPFAEKIDASFAEKIDAPFAEKIDVPFAAKIDAPFAEKIDAPFAEKIDAPFAEKIDVTVPLVVPVKTEVATKLTNPKKRFVRSFQEEKAKVQDRLEQLKKEKMAKEQERDHDKELLLKETSERVQLVESEFEELPVKHHKIEEEMPDIIDKKRFHHSSKKSERKSKYKPKRRGHYKEPDKRTDVVADIVNSFIDQDLDDNDTNKTKVTEEPSESNNSISELKLSDEQLNDKQEPITGLNEISNEASHSITEAAPDVDINEITKESNQDDLPEALEVFPKELQSEALQGGSKVEVFPKELQSEALQGGSKEVEINVPQESDEVMNAESKEVTEEPIKDIKQDVNEEVTQEPLSPQKAAEISTTLNESNPIEVVPIVSENYISSEKGDETIFETESIVTEENKMGSCPMEIEDTDLSPKKGVNKPRTKKILESYECDSLTSPDKISDSKSDDCNSTLPTSLPESPKSDGISSLNISVELCQSKKEELNESDNTCESIPDVNIPAANHTIDMNDICTNEIHEASILINTGNRNSEELSALNTLATLSEMIQPEFDIRALRTDENTSSTSDIVKEINSISDISVLDEEKLVDLKEEHLDVSGETATEVNEAAAAEIYESDPEANNDVSETVQEVVHIPENVPELNETVPEVLDKITVFPDEQLVKGQMEIVTLNSSDPVSNDSSKTDMELESNHENISVITETKNIISKSFVVHDPESESNYKELTTENTTVLEKTKIESLSAIEENGNVEPLQPSNEADNNMIEKDIIHSPTNVDCNKLVAHEDGEFLPTNENITETEEIQEPHEMHTMPISITPTPIFDETEALESINLNRNVDSGTDISQADTLSAAIANTIESEMAKLTDTAIDVATLPRLQKETSSSKLLEILSEPKSELEKPKRAPILQNPVEGHKKQMVLNRGSFSGTSKSSNKTIILSDQIIKPAKNETDSVVVQKVSNKRTLEDFEDIDAYIIQKPGKKPLVRQETEITPPAPKIMKKSSPRSRPRILQQTIITAAGDVIQPDGQQDDQAMFDINSMPIVLSDQILTPETIDNIPMILQDGAQASKVIQTVKNPPQTVKLLNKTSSDSVIKSSPKGVVRNYHRAPQRPSATTQKKGVLTVPMTQVKTNYILVPSTGTVATSLSLTGNKKAAIKRQGSQLLLQTTKPATTTTAEPTGNKIMIVTNNLGQQQRVVLTPAQHKLFMQQNNTKLKVTTATTTTVASKIVKANPRPNILTHPKTSLISTSTSSGQTILLAPTQMITPLTALQMKTATKVAPTKFKVTKFVHASGVVPNQQQGNVLGTKTIIFKNQHGQTFKKIQNSPEADLDRQVAEQIEAIKAAEANKTVVKAIQPVLTLKDAKVTKQLISTKKLVAAVKPQQQQHQQPTLQQRKSVVRKTFSDSSRTFALAGSSKVHGLSTVIPPLTPLLQQPQLQIQESIPSTVNTSIQTTLATTEKNDPSSFVSPNQVNLSPDKDGEKRQLVMQDDQGNMSAIPVGQILAIPNETIDGQAQSYMLVTMDETGNLIPINQETLMSIDPNILGNMVVQNDQVASKAELETQRGTEKVSLPAVIPQEVPETTMVPPLITAPPAPASTSDFLPSEQTAPTSEASSTLTHSEVATNLHSTTCNINNGDVNKQVVITGDPIVTQKFLESLAGNQELFNLLANAEGNLLIHSDGQQILINTTNTTVENTMLDQPDSSVEDRNPVMSNPSTKNHDILAAALADTDVIPSKLPLSQLSPGTSLYPLHVSNVLETSAMTSPIMTPLEVTETHSKKIDDILGQVPKSISDLPITITDPNISHTVSQQQLSNDIHPSLELPLSIPDPNAPTSVGMNSPSFPSYSLPNLDEDLSQKSFGQSISMPLLTDEPEESVTVATTEERSSTTDTLTDAAMKLDTTSAPSIMSTKEEYSLVDRMCSMRTSRICSSLSEPPPDMFDYTPEPVEVPEHQIHETKGENDSLLQKVTAAMKKAFEPDLPSTHNDIDMLADDTVAKVEGTLADNGSKDEDNKLTLSVIDSDKISLMPIDATEMDKAKMKEELFEPNLTPQFHSPSTNTDDSCEIPVQPPIVTALDDNKSDDTEMIDTKQCMDECDDNKICKLT